MSWSPSPAREWRCRFSLLFVARPLSVHLCLMPLRYPYRDVLTASWVGLRGAVLIILATYPLLAGLPEAQQIFNLVFFVVLSSVLIQGTSISWISRWLKTDAPFIPETKISNRV